MIFIKKAIRFRFANNVKILDVMCMANLKILLKNYQENI